MSVPILIDIPLAVPMRCKDAQPMSRLLIALYALLVFDILSFGAVEKWSFSILELGAALIFVIWAAHVAPPNILVHSFADFSLQIPANAAFC